MSPGSIRFAVALCLLAGLADARLLDRRGSGAPPPLTALKAGVAWAKPLQGGPIHVVFVAPAAALLDATALGAVIDVDCVQVPTPSRTEWGGDATTNALRQALRGKCDVVVLANVAFAAIPEDAQQAIADRVLGGAGLLIGFNQPAGAPGTPLEKLLVALSYDTPADAILGGVVRGPGAVEAEDAVHAADAGGVRVVQLDDPGDPPLTHALIPAPAFPLDAHQNELENAWSLAARAVRWLARREPRIAIRGLDDTAPRGPNDEEIPPDLPQEFVDAMRGAFVGEALRPYALALGAPADRKYQVRMRVRRPGAPMLGEVTFTAKQRIERGQTRFSLSLPSGPGVYWIDTWLLDGDAVVDWNTTEITGRGWPTFSNLDCSKEFLLANDTLDLAATVAPNAGQQRQCVLYARATDALGRVVTHNAVSMDAQGGRAQMRLDFADLLSPIVKLEVFAVEAEAHVFSEYELLASYREYRHFPVRLPERAEAPVLAVTVPAPAEYNARAYMAALSRAGAAALIAPAGTTPLFHAPFAGLSYWPEIAMPELPANVCPFARDYAARTVRAVQDQSLLVWAGGNARYLLPAPPPALGDTKHLAECPGCLARFHQFLQGQYPTLDALNAAWGAHFIDWEDIRPGDGEKPGADLRRFQWAGLRDYAAHARDAIRNVDKQARVGSAINPALSTPEGALAIAGAADFILLPPDAPLWASGVAQEGKIPRMALSIDLAALDDPVLAQAVAWRAALQHADAILCTPGIDTTARAGHGAALQPNGHAAPVFAAILGVSKALDEGVGALLNRATTVPADDKADGTPPPAGVIRYIYHFGEAEIAALWCAPDGDEKAGAHLKLPHSYSIDALSGEAIAAKGAWTPKLARGEAAIAISLPYRVKGVTVTAPEAVVTGRRLDFAVSVSADAAVGDHLLLVDLAPKDGPPRRHYRQYVVAAKGACKAYIPLALNEIPGAYRLIVRDVLSGVAATHKVRLDPNTSTPGK